MKTLISMCCWQTLNTQTSLLNIYIIIYKLSQQLNHINCLRGTIYIFRSQQVFLKWWHHNGVIYSGFLSFLVAGVLWKVDGCGFISSTYLDSWSNKISWQNLAEKSANFAGCWLLYTTLHLSPLPYICRLERLTALWLTLKL